MCKRLLTSETPPGSAQTTTRSPLAKWSSDKAADTTPPLSSCKPTTTKKSADDNNQNGGARTRERLSGIQKIKIQSNSVQNHSPQDQFSSKERQNHPQAQAVWSNLTLTWPPLQRGRPAACTGMPAICTAAEPSNVTQTLALHHRGERVSFAVNVGSRTPVRV